MMIAVIKTSVKKPIIDQNIITLWLVCFLRLTSYSYSTVTPAGKNMLLSLLIKHYILY